MPIYLLFGGHSAPFQRRSVSRVKLESAQIFLEDVRAYIATRNTMLHRVQ